MTRETCAACSTAHWARSQKVRSIEYVLYVHYVYSRRENVVSMGTRSKEVRRGDYTSDVPLCRYHSGIES